MTAPRILGLANNYEDFARILAARRRALGKPQLEIDHIAGLQDGYTGKLEIGGRRGGRNAGRVSLFLWLQALGVTIAVVELASNSNLSPGDIAVGKEDLTAERKRIEDRLDEKRLERGRLVVAGKSTKAADAEITRLEGLIEGLDDAERAVAVDEAERLASRREDHIRELHDVAIDTAEVLGACYEAVEKAARECAVTVAEALKLVRDRSEALASLHRLVVDGPGAYPNIPNVVQRAADEFGAIIKGALYAEVQPLQHLGSLALMHGGASSTAEESRKQLAAWLETIQRANHQRLMALTA
ncbi:MAG: hypothetical protein KIS96_01200 [Bauldia sp.]|nr:hypothetical protein [Bauldia sp.]